MIHTNLLIISIDDELTAFDFGIWPKNDICLIFSLKIKLRKLPCLFYLMNSNIESKNRSKCSPAVYI